jgi:hypothetical protein
MYEEYSIQTTHSWVNKEHNPPYFTAASFSKTCAPAIGGR